MNKQNINIIQLEKEKKTFARHYEDSISINASAEDIFTHLDDFDHVSSHMKQSSWMMGGGSMDTSIDEGHGQKVGSHVRMSGSAFGIVLFLDEVVTRYEPPRVKTWETVGDVKLLIIGHYRMSFEVEPLDSHSLLRVSFDYNLPSSNVWLGRLFGGSYAKWCVNQMIKGVREHFDAK